MQWLYFQRHNRETIREVLELKRIRSSQESTNITLGLTVTVWRGENCLTGCPSTPEGLLIEILLEEVATTRSGDLQFVWMPASLACKKLLENGTVSADWFWFEDAYTTRAGSLVFYMYPGWVGCG